MPEAWVAPTEFLARSLFTAASLCATGQRDLAAFWEFIEAHDGWVQFHDRHRGLLTSVMAMQGMILATTVVFLTTSPPVSFVDYTSPKSYYALSSAFVMALSGLAFQLAYFGVSHDLASRSLPEDELLNSRRAILTYLLSFRFPYLFVFFSLSFLTAGFTLAWPRTFAYLIGLILFCCSAIALQRRCLPVDSWVAPVVAILFVLIVLAYFFVVFLVSVDNP